ncbi:MAG: serine hydrolase [Terriglobales bacterium]
MGKPVIYLLFLLVISASLNAQTSAPASSEGQRSLRAKLEETIRDVDSRLDGAVGIAILDLTNGEWITFHADEVFPTASSIKVPLLVELYRQNEQAEKGQPGKAKLSDIYVVNKADDVPDSDIFNGLTPGVSKLTLRDLAQMVVAVSDNSATNVLIDRVGLQNVNQMLQSLSLTHTKLQRKMMDVKAAQEGRENLATPREFTMLFEALYRDKLMSQTSTDALLSLLKTRKDSPMQRAFMFNGKVADKPGELDAVRCDMGIIYAANRPFVISVMTSYLKSDRDGEDAIAEIAQAAYSYFDRVGRSSQYGRAMQPPAQP